MSSPEWSGHRGLKRDRPHDVLGSGNGIGSGRTRKRDTSDPSSNRPHEQRKHRRRCHQASRSPSPSPSPEPSTNSSEIEGITSGFDAQGRPSGPGVRMWSGAVKYGGRGRETETERGVLLRDGMGRVGEGSRARGDHRGDVGVEMAERVVHGVEDAAERRKTWRDLLSGFLEEASGGD